MLTHVLRLPRPPPTTGPLIATKLLMILQPVLPMISRRTPREGLTTIGGQNPLKRVTSLQRIVVLQPDLPVISTRTPREWLKTIGGQNPLKRVTFLQRMKMP
jgi:hypothetical protein